MDEPEKPWEHPLPILAQRLLNQHELAYRETLTIILAALGLEDEWSYDSSRGVLVRKRAEA
jgi:hypothetical protein